MNPQRIAELLEPFLGQGERRLTANDLDNISMYIDLLVRWNARLNLTAIRDPEEIVTRHFGESLFAARHLFPSTAPAGTAASGCPAERSSTVRLADVGSGAGFPGIPIKLWAPDISLTLIESNHKKAAFLREVIRALKLTNISVKTDRAETLLPGGFEIITLRAVERFDDILPVAAPLVVPCGRLALLLGSSQVDRITLPNVDWQPPIAIPQAESRILLLGRVNHRDQ